MTALRDPFEQIRAVADATLYEGYVLYPYRASSTKNRARWQFGVLMPPAYVAVDNSERDTCTTEVLLDARRDAQLVVEVRFLHVRQRSGPRGDDWSEAVDRAVRIEVGLADLDEAALTHAFDFGAEHNSEHDVSHDVREIKGAVGLYAELLPGPYGTRKLRVDVVNRTSGAARDRDDALRAAFVSTHTLLHIDRGHFLSLADPPQWARPYVELCHNEGTWPALAADDTVVLSAPIILGDDPQIAPESAGTLYDGTEIDEILTLRTMTLTDAEKAEARATDPRAAELIDRIDAMPQEYLDRLHGAVRYLRRVTGERDPVGAPTPVPQPPTFTTPSGTPWWDPGADASVSPDTDAIVIDGVAVSRGSRVKLRPGRRHTDAQDAFLLGRTATVEAVFFDVDGQQHLGVTLDEDPELAEIQRWHGRFLYFAPDEVEPMHRADDINGRTP